MFLDYGLQSHVIHPFILDSQGATMGAETILRLNFDFRRRISGVLLIFLHHPSGFTVTVRVEVVFAPQDQFAVLQSRPGTSSLLQKHHVPVESQIKSPANTHYSMSSTADPSRGLEHSTHTNAAVRRSGRFIPWSAFTLPEGTTCAHLFSGRR